jgi:hypothetical protein
MKRKELKEGVRVWWLGPYLKHLQALRNGGRALLLLLLLL